METTLRRLGARILTRVNWEPLTPLAGKKQKVESYRWSYLSLQNSVWTHSFSEPCKFKTSIDEKKIISIGAVVEKKKQKYTTSFFLNVSEGDFLALKSFNHHLNRQQLATAQQHRQHSKSPSIHTSFGLTNFLLLIQGISRQYVHSLLTLISILSPTLGSAGTQAKCNFL